MSKVKKFVTYELLNDFILLQEINEKSQCIRNYGKSFKNIIKTMEVDEVPFSVDVCLKNDKKELSSNFSFVLLLSENTNLSNHGKLQVKVTYLSGRSVSLTQVSLSCYTFSIPKVNKHDRVFIQVLFNKYPEPPTEVDFDYLRQLIGGEVDNENQNFTYNISVQLPALKRSNLDFSGVSSVIDTSFSCGESFHGEVATKNISPIGTGKPVSPVAEITNSGSVSAALEKIRKLAYTTIYHEYKKQLSSQHVLTTQETVELLKVSMGREADISANLIIVAAKVSYSWKMRVNFDYLMFLFLFFFYY